MVQAGQPTPDIVSPPVGNIPRGLPTPCPAPGPAPGCVPQHSPNFPLSRSFACSWQRLYHSSLHHSASAPVSWPHGLMASWPHGLMASWLHGFMASWLHGFMASACSGAFASSHQLHTYSPCTGVSWAIHSAPHIAHIPWTNDQQPIVIRPQCEYAISTLVNKH